MNLNQQANNSGFRLAPFKETSQKQIGKKEHKKTFFFWFGSLFVRPPNHQPTSNMSRTITITAEKSEAQTKADELARAMKVHECPASFELAPTPPAEVFKQTIEAVRGAFLLHNVLSEQECTQIIDFTEQLGFTDAPLSIGLNSAVMIRDVRDNKRSMWQADQKTLEALWQRIGHLLPQRVQFDDKSRLSGTWEIVDGARGLNERFRFYKYAANEHFQPHYDGCFPRSPDEQSHLTLIIYLNEGFDGGQTTFFVGDEETEAVSVDPHRGTALLFFHSGHDSPLHEGTPHHSQSQFKFVLRSDVMYRRC